MNKIHIAIVIFSSLLFISISNAQGPLTQATFMQYAEVFSSSEGMGTCREAEVRESDSSYFILLDTTDPLDQQQTQFVLDNYIDQWRYAKGDRFTVMTLSDEPVETASFYSFCAPLHIEDSSWIFDSPARVQAMNMRFGQVLHYAVTELAERNQVESDTSLLIEALQQVYLNSRYGFTEKEKNRKLIIVSDLFQNSDRISFFKLCGPANPGIFAGPSPLVCPSLEEMIASDPLIANSIRLATAGIELDSGDSVKIYYRNVNEKIDASAEPWWREYFSLIGLPEDNIEFTYQLGTN